jgi:hypothetical protein
MDISFHPPRDPEERRSVRAMVGGVRRFFGWLGDFHKFVVALVSVATLTIGAHVWLKGLITRKELEVAVEAAVTKATRDALLEVRGDLEIIKTNTGGIKDWRGETTEKLIKLDERATAATKEATKANDRIDAYLDKRGHTR